MTKNTQFSVVLPAVGGDAVSGNSEAIISPDPPPVIDLSDKEKDVYDYLCASLRGAGVEHLTAGMPIAVIVRTFIDWLDAAEKCRLEGRTQTSKTGWVTPLPWADDERRLKMELGQWLPKACLTIPSLARVRKDTGEKSGQDDLFSDLVNHATNSPAGRLMN